MRLLHFCNYADRVGGAEVYAQALIEAQRSRGHEVALFGASPDGEVDRPGLRVIQRPPYDAQRLVLDPAARNALREYLQRFEPDVLHVHNIFSVSLEVLRELGRCNVPVLHTVHDFQLLCPNSWCVRGDGAPCPGGAGEQCFQHGCERNYPYDSWGVFLTALRQQLMTRIATVAIAPSMYLVERLRANGWPRVEHLPYFIEFTPAAADAPRTDHELLYVGRLEREKGVEVLLRGLVEIRAQIPNARLTLIGSGSMETPLRRLAEELKLGASARFLTAIPRAEIASYYATSALCVLPSVWSENSPLVAYECLLSGVPMVGSHIGGIPELIGEDCGFTFASRDPKGLAEAAVRLLRLPLAERERMSARARARSSTFAKAKHLDTLDNLYDGIQSAGTRVPALEESWLELLPVLHRVGSSLATPVSPGGLLQRVRALARSLGLPKVIRNA